MTLNISVCIPQMGQCQKSVDTASRPQDRRHGCRHPPPPVHPNQSAKWDFERTSAGVVAALRSGLLKIDSVWLYVTPARKNSYQWRRPLGLRCLSLSEWN